MAKTERVVLVGVQTPENFHTFEESMEELENLAQTANGKVVSSIRQNRDQFDHQTIIGKGKLQELQELIEVSEIDLVIFNHELTPRQGQLIEEALETPTIDRIQLILDIFAQRARSKEGKLQVELAQLEYSFPRIIGQGKTLSRLGGGIGTRGPGETKLETDRRLIRKKMTSIRRELKEVEAHRKRTRQQRNEQQVYQIGLVGYTNSGKSTLLNLLTSADTYEKDQLFATLDPLTKKWRLPEGFEVTITDTVGFIQDLPTQLVDAFHSTLEESQNMDLLLHVIDASAKNRQQQEQTVIESMDELQLRQIPVLVVYNKADLIEKDSFVPTLFPNVLLSAKDPASKDQLVEAIKSIMMEQLQPYTLVLAPDEGRLLEQLKQNTLVVSTDFEEKKQEYIVKGFAKENSFAITHMNQTK
ncbi:GTPase HflX [Tetragenococcus solitarius]|uniref:GTPase HflX n=1 Tax=Tetragenococcus solitarius TaxID=71453 RepID=A0ABP6KII3_9ENTE|nr:GTPase HflX [Tetragenococcus solitarius]